MKSSSLGASTNESSSSQSTPIRGGTSQSSRTSESSRRRSSDPISWYLASIGREPLLTPAEEIELGNQVQAMMQLLEAAKPSYSDHEKKLLRIGKRSKQRMMKANLRLVVSVAKKYQGKGLELLDLIQEGSLGLERAVEKFDPTRGYKFSTYAFWWIRQSMTRAIACQSRTIRLPVHLSERLSAIRKVSLDLAHKLGAMPSRHEIAEAMDMPLDELDGLLRQALTTSSLDAPVNGDEGRSFLGDLIADSSEEEPLDRVERGLNHEQLDHWMNHLSEQERHVLQLRFGLEGRDRHTLAEIGRQLDVSRERVRQVELKALRKLRNLTRRLPSGI
ncbi:type II alternative RNA polymerase sigma factor, sigma-70 family [Cyanobium sp. PCC 7001]|uniref:sigma-70 family RNA polymerase sigma factor n=1 Tax=Cyanobium sp. PCC 7001 TaxID=180281 RepID=UPI00018050BC|nr:sigma-70 family RNA polymerase sigma factor [Cyanobium sp. PCC 7001]EDY39892.1 type II alternative RNA polymerase sigma factor, sigma-70 family [Cyanobium sp. PCC 7001]